MSLDFTKPVQTRHGIPVEILRAGVNHPEYQVVGIRKYPDGSEAISTWTQEGKFNIFTKGQEALDLVQQPEEKTIWINIYSGEGCCGFAYHSLEAAERASNNARTARVKVTFTEGQFDESD